MALDTAGAAEPVRQAVLAHVALGKGSALEFLPVHSQNVVFRGDPECAKLVLGEAENGFAEGWRRPGGRLNAAGGAERQPGGGAHPENAGRIFEETVHIARGVALPATFREGA